MPNQMMEHQYQIVSRMVVLLILGITDCRIPGLGKAINPWIQLPYNTMLTHDNMQTVA